jgi:hypothetical protein
MEFRSRLNRQGGIHQRIQRNEFVFWMKMKMFATWVALGVICASANGAWAQLQMEADESSRVFAGTTQAVSTRWCNIGEAIIETDIRIRTMQLSSATAAVSGEMPWKTLRVLPGQTIVETGQFAFPAVRAETRYLVQWVDGFNRIAGASEIFVYPTNLLSELQPLVGKEGGLGVFDPQNELKELLKNVGVDFVDLGNTELEKFRGKLAIIGPFDSKTLADSVATMQIKALAKNDVGVVWVQPAVGDSRSPNETLQPSFYAVPENQTAAVVVQPEMVANLARNPRSQLNLIYFCKLALHPQPLTLPSVKKQS